MKTRYIILASVGLIFLAANLLAKDSGRIQPYGKNPFYWQYNGKPMLLLGGSDDDNLFQHPDLRNHLDAIKVAGGNYIRNTMSDRPDRNEVYAFRKLADGKYDLNQWNSEYWQRFNNLLQWTAERDIIVQIEIWDRFDYTDNNKSNRWQKHPYNPKNNINYNYKQSGFAKAYPKHPGANRQPFFFTTPMQRNNPVVLEFQQRFVDKVLSYSLNHRHVLYCMDNETSGEEAWGVYWAGYIKHHAREQGENVCTTEMWDDWNLQASSHRRTFDYPERYDYVDISQNNHQKGQRHWDNFQWVRRYLFNKPRPINTVKTYGANNNKFGHSDQDGVERFWRHIIGGTASARFHRPSSGLGLSSRAIASIRAARKMESLVSMWETQPTQSLLRGREENEAYAAANPGQAYVVYFTQGGSVDLDLRPVNRDLQLRWISVMSGRWGEAVKFRGGSWATLKAPNNDSWVAVVLSVRD